ncbi:hypothetical protein KXJ69_04755 [Aureisphaera sp. CAU 1614]|uniref:Uncharacterized protein n=1 Tax=Halomarinibacterium sedimenti TaxID=2857106 RepID=A0A9X1FMX5_9FLAO|nr:hypothetical protein [Halomarinibacterium sedimenti]MBW2937402.1 hypothetical protein [Halomarinibacterium sedimenti]
MKILKTLSLLFLSILILSCSKKDDGGSDTDAEATFNATINGGPYSNLAATLGSYSADSSNGFTIAVVDANGNTIRLFMNSTGGFTNGVTKEVGNIDSNGFQTSALFRDAQTQVIYNSISGSMKITQNKESNNDPSNRVVTGTFNITANINTGTTITMTGSFNNILVSGL